MTKKPDKKRGLGGRSFEMVLQQPLDACLQVVESLESTDISQRRLTSVTVKTNRESATLYRFMIQYQKLFEKQITYTTISELHGTLQFDDNYETTTIAGVVTYPYPTNDGLVFCGLLLLTLLVSYLSDGQHGLFQTQIALGVAIFSVWIIYHVRGQQWNTVDLIRMIQRKFEVKTS